MAKILLGLDYKAWQQKGQNLAVAGAIGCAPATKEHCAVATSEPQFKGLKEVV